MDAPVPGRRNLIHGVEIETVLWTNRNKTTTKRHKKLQNNEASAIPTPIVVGAEEGPVLHAFGDTVQVKLSGEQTKGSLAVVLDTTPPGAGPPPHIHHNEDELLLILEGQYRFLVGGQWSEPVGPGTAVYIPRGAHHTFQNIGDTLSRHWVVTTPSGFEQFFSKCAAVFAQSEPPDMMRILSVCGEHGLEFVPPLGGSAPATLDSEDAASR